MLLGKVRATFQRLARRGALQHNSLNLNQFKVKLCCKHKVLERPLCAQKGARRSSPECVVLTHFHQSVKVRQCFAALGAERAARFVSSDDAVGSKRAESITQFAPANHSPDLAPEPQTKRTDIPLALTGFQIAIPDVENRAFINCALDSIDDTAFAYAD